MNTEYRNGFKGCLDYMEFWNALGLCGIYMHIWNDFKRVRNTHRISSPEWHPFYLDSHQLITDAFLKI